MALERPPRLPPFPHRKYVTFSRFSASADTTVRKWLASSSQVASSFQFPGDAVELSRLSQGRPSASKAAATVPAAAAAAAGGVGVKRVGVADMVVVPVVTKVAEEGVGAEAHDNSMGGVDVINKHTDKVGVICDGDVYAVICYLMSRGFRPYSRSQIHCLKLWSGMALTASRCATLSLGVTIPPAISRAFPALFSATVPSNAVPWALSLDQM